MNDGEVTKLMKAAGNDDQQKRGKYLDELEAQLDRLREENERLKSQMKTERPNEEQTTGAPAVSADSEGMDNVCEKPSETFKKDGQRKQREEDEERKKGVSCGFCDSNQAGPCPCEDLGFKEVTSLTTDISDEDKRAPAKTLEDVLAGFQDFQPLEAVPLKRRHKSRQTGTVPPSPSARKRFKRVASETAICKNPTGAVPVSDSAAAESVAGISDLPGSGASWAGLARMDDKCGFCGDGLACVCVGEVSIEQVQEPKEQLCAQKKDQVVVPSTSAISSSIQSRRGSQLQIGKSRSKEIPAKCEKIGGGNCEQCLHDPFSTLFCASLEALSRQQRVTQLHGLTITCTMAYRTLSRHEKFRDSDLGEILRGIQYKDGQVTTHSVSEVLKRLG